MMKNKIKMSKAEDLSRQYVLPLLDEQYKKYGERKQMELTRFDGYDMMSAYEEGYHQAEKDLELNVEDIKIILDAENDILHECNDSSKLVIETYPKGEDYYGEILKRFKELKK